MWDILKENIFDEAAHIDKSQVPFNALNKERATNHSVFASYM